MIIEGKNKDYGNGVFISDLQQGSAAEIVSPIPAGHPNQYISIAIHFLKVILKKKSVNHINIVYRKFI